MLKDNAFDLLVTPFLLCVNIKVSKTDPFCRGTAIHIGRGHYALCAIQALAMYLAARGDGPGPLFRFLSGQLLSQLLYLSKLNLETGLAGQQSFPRLICSCGVATSLQGHVHVIA